MPPCFPTEKNLDFELPKTEKAGDSHRSWGESPKMIVINGMAPFMGHKIPETNIAPENGWLEDEFPFGMAYF